MAFVSGLGWTRNVNRRRICKAVVSESESASSLSVQNDESAWLENVLSSRRQEKREMQEFRVRGESAVRASQVPGRKMEEWRFTNLAPLYETKFGGETTGDVDLSEYFDDEAQARAVFIDGVLSKDLSDLEGIPEGSFVGSIGDLPEKQAEAALEAMMSKNTGLDGSDFFAKLNTACAEDALVIRLNNEAIFDKPLQVIIAYSGPKEQLANLSHPRVVLLAGANSAVSIVEQHVGLSSTFTNNCVSLQIGDGANISYIIVNETGNSGFQMSTVHGDIGRDANASVVMIGVGGRISRTNVSLDMEKPGASASVNGLAIADGERVIDLTSRIIHNANNCGSSQLQKNVATEKGRTVFRGRIKVTEEGDGADSEQLCRSLLLSKKATVDAMPVLEIDTEDVQCSHGATVADLEDEEIFYCMSRGLSRETARFLLLRSFVEDVLKDVPFSSCKKLVLERVEALIPSLDGDEEKKAIFRSI